MKRRRALGFWALLPGLAAGSFAAVHPPAIGQRIIMMGPKESIAATHQTRVARLRRIARELGISPEPRFYEYVVPASKMPTDYRYDVPVLRIVFPERTFFTTASAVTVREAQPLVAAMAKALEGDVPDVVVFVAGHTDSRGTDPYNQDLSIRRARAVAEALRAAGADNPRMWSIGFGETLPVAENVGDYNLSLNRRVEFLLSSRLESVAVWMRDQAAITCTEGTVDARGRCVRTVNSLRPRSSFTADPVIRRNVRPTMRPGIPVRPPDRRIIITLRERRYIVPNMEH